MRQKSHRIVYETATRVRFLLTEGLDCFLSDDDWPLGMAKTPAQWGQVTVTKTKERSRKSGDALIWTSSISQCGHFMVISLCSSPTRKARSVRLRDSSYRTGDSQFSTPNSCEVARQETSLMEPENQCRRIGLQPRTAKSSRSSNFVDIRSCGKSIAQAFTGHLQKQSFEIRLLCFDPQDRDSQLFELA